MSSSGWMVANWVLTAIGTIGGIPAIVLGVNQMFRYFWPVKVQILEAAYLEYDNTRREYIIEIPKVAVTVRRAIVLKENCFEFGGSRLCYPNVEWAIGNKYEMLEKSEVLPMRFTTEIYREKDLQILQQERKNRIEGRIVFEWKWGFWGKHIFKCKSKRFPVAPPSTILHIRG